MGKRKYNDRKQIKCTEVELIMKNLKIDGLLKSWRDTTSNYGRICVALRKKNIQENRLRIRNCIEMIKHKKKHRNEQVCKDNVDESKEDIGNYNKESLPTEAVEAQQMNILSGQINDEDDSNRDHKDEDSTASKIGNTCSNKSVNKVDNQTVHESDTSPANEKSADDGHMHGSTDMSDEDEEIFLPLDTDNLLDPERDVSYKTGDEQILSHQQIHVSHQVGDDSSNTTIGKKRSYSELSENLTHSLSTDTLQATFGPDITKEFFETDVPTTGAFTMSFSVWKKLSNSQRNRCLQKGSWEHIVSEGIKRYNPYCVYMFRWHRVSVARIRARQKCAPLFSGEAECKFKDCKNICRFSMNQNNRVHLKMNSTVKHRVSENHSRPFRGETREKLKTIFKEGQKPYKHFLQRMKDTAKDVKIAGNFSNTGNTPRTFQQISSESRYENKLDKSEFESLVKLSSQMETEITSKHSPGFIQHVSILPPYIMYWTETGIRIWHDLAKSSVVHWDATGGLLSRRNDQYKFYYYELACPNPVPGQPLIPVCGMISSLHSTPLVRFWLAEFRRVEKKIYGHSNISIPRQVTSDRSLVFIQASLSEFNNENLNNFRTRAFRILNGCAKGDDLHLIIPHACLSHVMNSFKKTTLQHYKSNFEFGMYCLSVLLHSSKLSDVKERLCAVYHVLSAQHLDSETKNYFQALEHYISQLQIDRENLTEPPEETDYDMPDESVDIFTEHENPDHLTEEEFNYRSTQNEFSNLANGILSTVLAEKTSNASLNDLEVNKRYSPTFIEKIQKLYMPTFPLWSNLLLGDLSRHGTSEVYANYTPPKHVVHGNSKMEKRFQIVKDISLSGKTSKRLDELSVQLKEHTIAVQEYSLLHSVKPGKKTNRQGRSSKTIEEQWDKRKPTGKENTLLGKYQRVPKQEKLDTLKEGSKLKKNAKINTKRQDKTQDTAEQLKADKNLTKKTVQNTTTQGDMKKTMFEQYAKADEQEQEMNKDEELFNSDAVFASTTIDYKQNMYLQEIYKKRVKDIEDFNYLDRIKDSSTGLHNLGNTCWFNAVIQMFTKTRFMRDINEQFNLQMSYEEDLRSVLAVFDKVGKGEEVSTGLLQSSLNALNTLFGLDPTHQNDVHEFVTTVLRHFMDVCGVENFIAVKEAYVCTVCGIETGIDNQIYCDLQLHISEDVKQNEGIKDLLDRYFEDDEIDYICCDIKKWKHIRLCNLPVDLSICLVRHGIKNTRITKNRKKVFIDMIVNMGKYMQQPKDVIYRLKGVVVHHGVSPRNGHYTFIKADGGVQVEIDDTSHRIFDGHNLLTDSYLLHYERIPDDKNICHRFLPDVIISIMASNGWKKVVDHLEYSPGLSVRKHELLQLLQEIEINDETVNHSWEAYNLLQEGIGRLDFYKEDLSSIEDITTAVLRYFCENCPSVLERSFGVTSIKQENCSHCLTNKTTIQHKLLIDFNTLTLVEKPSCTDGLMCILCGKLSYTEKEIVINVGETVLAGSCSDFCLPDFQNTITQFKPIATLSSSGTILYRHKDDEIDVLIVESAAHVHQTEGDKFESMQTSYENVLLFLDNSFMNESCVPNFEIILPTSNEETNRAQLSLSLTEKEQHLTNIFQAPVTVGNIPLDLDDVNRFLNNTFSDKNIDSFLNTLISEDSLMIPAAWFAAKLDCGFFTKPDTVTSWYCFKNIFIPANVENKHWLLLVVLPNERELFYLDPLGNPPDHDVLSKICKYLNHQCVLETFCTKNKVWKIQDLMKTGRFPKQADLTSCGPMVCLFAKLIQEGKILKERVITSELVRMYIMHEIIRVYQETAEESNSFCLRDIIFTDDLDEIVHRIMTGNQPENVLHNNFLRNAGNMKRKGLCGFGLDFVTLDDFDAIEMYLYDRYIKSVKQLFKCPVKQSVFEDAEELNKKLKQNSMYADWYVHIVLVKEVLVEVLSRTKTMVRSELRRLCSNTEFSCTEEIREEIRKIREAKKKTKMMD